MSLFLLLCSESWPDLESSSARETQAPGSVDIFTWEFCHTPAIIGALWAVSLLWYISLAAVTFQRCWSMALVNYFSVVRACGAASLSDDQRGFIASKYLKKTGSRGSCLFFTLLSPFYMTVSDTCTVASN